jgi:hypothetical protein
MGMTGTGKDTRDVVIFIPATQDRRERKRAKQEKEAKRARRIRNNGSLPSLYKDS